MVSLSRIRQSGVIAAIAAAVLFGAGTPIAKSLLGDIQPWMLAGLLYLGSGLGLTIYRYVRKAAPIRLPVAEALWFSGAILAGGIVGPVLLMTGLTQMPASGASLLLNTESLFTALLAWFAFKENFDTRIALGMLFILVGAIILSIPTHSQQGDIWPSLAIIGACFAWGIDNNLTRKVSLSDATWVACVKGWGAGIVNITLAFLLGAHLPPVLSSIEAMVVGFLAYGVSLTLFVLGLRNLGTARTGAYFAVAPFFGAVLAVAMGEPVTWTLVLAALFMGGGVWLHLIERHEHQHTHNPMTHTHVHIHDAHHQHSHDFPVEAGVEHTHEHSHEILTHSHVHYPDAHHQHKH